MEACVDDKREWRSSLRVTVVTSGEGNNKYGSEEEGWMGGRFLFISFEFYEI